MKITKKIISVLLSLALVLSVSAVTVSAIDETTVTYYIGDTAVKTVSEFVTAQHKPRFYAPDLQPDLVPANSYFTGWYLTPDCEGSPISPDGVYFSAEGLKLYAGFKQYESRFTPHYSTDGFERFDRTRIQVFYPRMMGDTFVPNIQNVRYSTTTTTTDTEGDNVWRLLVSGASPYFFYDENAVAYQVKPGVSYKVSFQYKYEFPATNTTEVFFEVGIGSKTSNFTSDGKMTGDANSYKYRQRVEKIIPSKLGPTAKTNWETVELVLPALTEADLETHYPILGFRTTHCSNEGLIDIKNLVVEEYIPEPVKVVYNYLNENGEAAQRVITEGVAFGDNYAIDFLAPNTKTQYFVDWYTTEDFSGEPISDSSIKLTNDGANNLYAKYVDYPASAELILPGNGTNTTKVNMPIITNAEFGSQPTDKINAYKRQVNSSIPFIESSTYNAETNETELLIGPTGAATSAHIITDKNGNFVAGKPGATYKVTLWAKSSAAVKINFGAGIPKTHFQLFFGNAQWYRAPNQGSGYRELLHKSLDETINSKTYKEYTLMLTIPENYPKTEYNFLGLRFGGAAKNTSICIKDIVVYEVDINAPEEMFVTFENYTNFSKYALLDETNKYIITKNTAEYTVWENANQDGVWANPSKTEKIYTVFGGAGFSPKNFAIVDGGMNSEKALKFKQTASGTAFKVADISNGVQLKDNTTYTATFYYKAEGDSSSDLKFSILNALNNENLGMITSANTVVIPANQVSGEWTKVTLTFTTDFGYHNADYAISKHMFCIPVICVNSDIDDTARTVYIDNVKLETSINCGGVSVLTPEAEEEENAQALRVYFNYTPDENGKITVGGELISVVLLAPLAKLNNKTDKDGNFIREKIETPNIFVKENVGQYGIICAEKAENLTDCWANENGILTYSTYIKNFEVNDEKEIAVRGYIELSDGRVIYSDIYNYSVNDIKAVNQLGTETTYYDFTKQEVYEKLVLQGNSKVIETGITSDWNSQTIKFKANCVGDITVKVHNPLGTEVCFKVLVDGNRVTGEFRPIGVDAENGISEFTFNVGSKAGIKEIQIARITEVISGPTEIMGVEFIGELVKAEEAETLIEFIGDSITCGMGNGGNVSDGTRTYAFLTAQKLGFDYRIRSRSGSGFKTDSGGGQGLGGSWPVTYVVDSYVRSATTPYSINKEADVVCIYLGTNDYTAAGSKPIEERNAYFVDGMKNLISIVKQYNPNAKFVWITGGMTNGYKDAAITAMNDLGGEASGYYVCQLPSGLNAGGAGHPTYDQHAQMAEIFSEFLTEKGLVK